MGLFNNKQMLLWFLLSFITGFLTACSGSDMTDLEEYVAEIKARRNPFVDPIPEFKIVPSYFYEPQGRDPFENILASSNKPLVLVQPGEERPECPQPNRDRLPQELEKVPLDSLEMVGTLQDSSNMLWGLVKSKTDGTVYQIKNGDYMGQNFGEIISISEQEIQLRELYPNEAGCFEEQVSKIALSANNK